MNVYVHYSHYVMDCKWHIVDNDIGGDAYDDDDDDDDDKDTTVLIQPARVVV